jgi:hypothetical protein
MAFPEALPFTRQHMGAIPLREWRVVHQQFKHRIELVKRSATLSHTFVVFLKGRAKLDSPHIMS